MVRILDSEQMPKYSVKKSRKRTTQAMSNGDKVHYGNRQRTQRRLGRQFSLEISIKHRRLTKSSKNFCLAYRPYAQLLNRRSLFTPRKGEWQDALKLCKGLPPVDYALLSIYETLQATQHRAVLIYI